jgi:enoyl-[acyl-carrier protein] reductase II
MIFFHRVEGVYQAGGDVEQLKALLGRGRAKKGMFEGDLVEGELEIGQVAGIINDIKPVKEIIHEIMDEYLMAKTELLEGKGVYDF